MLWQQGLAKPSKICWFTAGPLEIPLCTEEHRTRYIFFFPLTSFLCSLAVKSQLTVLPHFSIWSDIVVEKHKCLLAPLQVFVSQLKMSHGSVPKSGFKLLQMFSNDRLQCQHQPTSTFVYYIFLFDVAQTNFSVSRTFSGLLRNPQVGDFYFVDREKLSECGFVCQHKLFQPVICSVVIRLF